MLDEDIARLSAYMRKHINVHGHYSFRLPDLGGTGRPLRQGARRDRNTSATVTARMIVPMDSTTSVVGTSLKVNTS